MDIKINKNRGFSLFELLIIIGLIAIFSIGFMTTYYHFMKFERTERFFIKSEADVQVLVNQLKKIFSAIGYGVPINYFNISQICNRTSVISYNGSNFCFLSTFLRQTLYAGCWWICSMNNFNTKAQSRFSNNCPSLERLLNDTNHNWFMVLDSSKRLKLSGTNNINCEGQNQGDTVIYLGKRSSNANYNFPDDFLISIFLDNTNLPLRCANNTANLYIKVGSDVSQPLISCIGDFRISFITKYGTYTTNVGEFINDFSKLWGIRVCLLLQIGGRRDNREVLPQYSIKCGNYTSFSHWEYYRWKVVEEDIPLYNIINWKN